MKCEERARRAIGVRGTGTPVSHFPPIALHALSPHVLRSPNSPPPSLLYSCHAGYRFGKDQDKILMNLEDKLTVNLFKLYIFSVSCPLLQFC